MTRRRLVYMPLAEIAPADRNAKRHAAATIDASLNRFGFVEPVVLDERTGKLLAGHGRREALMAKEAAGEDPPDGIVLKDGVWQAPVVRGVSSTSDADAHALGIMLNRSTELGGWDAATLLDMREELATADPAGLENLGFTPTNIEAMLAELSSTPPEQPAARPTLVERFGVPPFSVLDARQGYWQARKAQWLALGIQSELGRPRNFLAEQPEPGRNRSTPGPADPSGNDPQFYRKKQLAEARLGRDLTTAEFLADHYEGSSAYTEGISVFDPVLCELAYRWWCPPGGLVLDPFAGGSVRGIVASLLGRQYFGVELRPEQVAANLEQAERICSGPAAPPLWIVGDSAEVGLQTHGKRAPADFLFTCPPYFDLEQYSDDPADLSNADSFDAFVEGYAGIVAAHAEQLAPNRFACFVVGNVRAPGGQLHDLAGATVQAFADAGLEYYNDAVLVTAVGSLALRASFNFQLRKLGRCHQQVLVFVKGDVRAAVEACGPVEAQVPLEE